MKHIRAIAAFLRPTALAVPIAILCLCAVQVVDAQARGHHNGDMLADKGWLMSDRPAVPSDYTRRLPEMFDSSALPPISTKADVFEDVRLRNTLGREEMVRARPMRVPPYPLFDYPSGYDDRTVGER